jgi:hypothetical protein
MENIAEIASIKMLRNVQIGSWPLLNSSQNVINTAVVPSTGTWTPIDFVIYTAELSVKMVEVNDTEFWDVAVSFTMAKLQADQYRMSAAARYRYVVDVTCANGARLLLGTPEDLLRLSVDDSSGKKGGAMNGSRLVVKARLRQRPPFYTP